MQIPLDVIKQRSTVCNFPPGFNADSHILKLRLTSAQRSAHSSLPPSPSPHPDYRSHVPPHRSHRRRGGADLKPALWQLVAHPEQKIPTFPDFYYPFHSLFVFKHNSTSARTEQQARWSRLYMNESPSQLQKCSPGGNYCLGSGLYGLTLKISIILPPSVTIAQRGSLALRLALAGTPGGKTCKNSDSLCCPQRRKMYFLIYSAEALRSYILSRPYIIWVYHIRLNLSFSHCVWRNDAKVLDQRHTWICFILVGLMYTFFSWASDLAVWKPKEEKKKNQSLYWNWL